MTDPAICPVQHELHVSSIKSFLGCRRRWDWIFNKYYYPPMTAKPLEFGVAYHKAMETYYNPETWHEPREVVAQEALLVFNTVVAKQRIAALQAVGQEALDSEVEQDYRERVDLGRNMLKYHLNKIAPQVDEGLRPWGVEVPFLIPVIDIDTGIPLLCSLCGTAIMFGGRIDCIMEDHDGDFWIVDWKTAARLHEDDDQFLANEMQITGYVMAVRRRLRIKVRGFIYHEQKKGYPKEPEALTRMYKGRWFSTNKNQDTDLPTFLRTLTEHGEDPTVYFDYIEWLKENPTQFYVRFAIDRNDAELDNNERDLYQIALEMTNPNLAMYPNPGRFSCKTCAFRSPCLMKNDGSDFLYYLDSSMDKRSKQYWEKEESTTDSRMDTVG
jgi:hypothetical protein